MSELVSAPAATINGHMPGAPELKHMGPANPTDNSITIQATNMAN